MTSSADASLLPFLCSNRQLRRRSRTSLMPPLSSDDRFRSVSWVQRCREATCHHPIGGFRPVTALDGRLPGFHPRRRVQFLQYNNCNKARHRAARKVAPTVGFPTREFAT